MKQIFFTILFIYSCFAVKAQGIDTLTEAKKECKTAEQVLGLASVYTVIKCDITITTPDREVFMVFYAKNGSRYCLNANSANFEELWSQQVMYMASKIKGARITINNIIIQKGDKEMKLVSKTFVVP